METILSKSRNTELSFNERFIMELSVLAVMCAAKLIMFGGSVSEPILWLYQVLVKSSQCQTQLHFGGKNG